MRRRILASRRGNVAVIAALALTGILSFTAIALDGGLLQNSRRQVQAAADAAALAAADNLFSNYLSNAGADVGDVAKTKARAIAAANGFPNDDVTSTVEVNIPPLNGPFAGMNSYAEVIITYQQKRGFSRIFGSGDLPVKARAVAVGKYDSFRNGILVLDPTLPGALNNNGNGSIKVLNADVIVDSNAPDAAVATGSGSITAPNFYITGNPGTSTSGSGTFNGTIYNDQTPTPDPLANMPVPDPSTMTLQSHNATNVSGNKTVTLSPGVYKGGIHISGQVTVNMEPGIYYMDGGGFSFTGQGNLNATGVMVYTAPKSNSDVININGLGQVNFTPPTSGLYQGMALWQERSSTNTVYLTGNGSSALYGAIYAQHGMLTVSGNGSQDVIGSQYISYDVNLGGNGNFNISWRTDMTARTRVIYLVE